MRLHVGDLGSAEISLKSDGALADPVALSIEIEDAAGGISEGSWPDPGDSFEIRRIAAGRFVLQFPIEVEGIYTWTWTATADEDHPLEDLVETGELLAYPRALKRMRPTTASVAATRKARTYVDGADLPAGSTAGDFTDDTNPTADEVDKLIDEMVDDVCALFSSGVVPEASWPDARRAIVCKVVLTIELGDPEMTLESSPYLQLRQEAKNAVAALTNKAQVNDLFGE